MLERGRRQRDHGRGSVGAEHPLGRQLPRVVVEEALAERPLPLHQEHDGAASTSLLNEERNLFICMNKAEIKKTEFLLY